MHLDIDQSPYRYWQLDGIVVVAQRKDAHLAERAIGSPRRFRGP